MVAPVTLSPGALSTGILSPVSILSSTADSPVMTTPSAGMREPGFTRSISPTRTCSKGISVSLPSRSTRAVLGARAISRLMLSPVRPLELSSMVLPRSTRAIIIEELSK